MTSLERNREMLLILALVFLSSAGVVAQEKKVAFGLSLDQGISTFSNAEKVVDGVFNPAVGVSNPDTKNPVLPWYTNSLAFDSYIRKHIIISVGLRFFHMKNVQDSSLTTYFITPYYGRKKTWSSSGMPFIKVGHRYKIKGKFYGLNSISFGAIQLFDRYKSYGTPYSSTTSAINTWENQNRIYRGFNYDVYVDKKALTLEMESSVCYEVGIWSFKVGLAYFYYRNPPIEGYHGLHVKVGASVRFEKNDKSGKK